MRKIQTNNISLIVFALLFLGSIQTTNAQFFKKLKKRAEQAAKEAVLRKAEDKAAQTVEKGMDKLFNFDFKQKSIDPSILPLSYDFEWEYKLNMKAKVGHYDLSYFLKPGANYFGSKPNTKQQMTNGMFMILDDSLKVMTILTAISEKKSGHIVAVPENTAEQVETEEELMKDMNFKELGTKEILGYQCQGFQIENKEIKMIMYVTFGAPVSFNHVFGGSNEKALPKGFDPKWLKGADDSLMMEMTFINKRKKKFNMSMTCVGLQKVQKTVTIGDYEFMKIDTPEFED